MVPLDADLNQSNDSFDWLTLDEAYKLVLQKGYKGSKDAFRKWVNRKPEEVRSQFGMTYHPELAGRAGNYKPYKIETFEK